MKSLAFRDDGMVFGTDFEYAIHSSTNDGATFGHVVGNSDADDVNQQAAFYFPSDGVTIYAGGRILRMTTGEFNEYEVIPLPDDSGVRCSFALSPDSFYLGTGQTLYHSVDGGLTYTAVDIDIGSPFSVRTITARPGEDILVLTNKCLAYSKDVDATWSLRGNGFGSVAPEWSIQIWPNGELFSRAERGASIANVNVNVNEW